MFQIKRAAASKSIPHPPFLGACGITMRASAGFLGTENQYQPSWPVSHQGTSRDRQNHHVKNPSYKKPFIGTSAGRKSLAQIVPVAKALSASDFIQIFAY
jgi:hypothetical protein